MIRQMPVPIQVGFEGHEDLKLIGGINFQNSGGQGGNVILKNVETWQSLAS
jgi:hypothetical protein